MDIVTPLPRVDSSLHSHSRSGLGLDLLGGGGGGTPNHSRTNSWSSDFGISQIQLKETSLSSPQHRKPPRAPAPSKPSHQAPSWEPDVAARIRKGVLDPASNRPYMVALVGIPGSGKSVSSFLLANMLDETDCDCMVMPHDGYHYSLEHLKLFPNPEDAIYRRGAPDTFDPVALKRDLLRIREGDEDFITLPAFDHAVGDPEPDRHAFDRAKHKVVLCEGLYLLHDDDGWEDIRSVFDLTIFMDSNVDNCIERVKIRNQCIPGYTVEEMMERCEKVDRVNAMTVMKSKKYADVVVEAASTFTAPAAPLVSPPFSPKTSSSNLNHVLSALSLKDVDMLDDVNTDWALDITSRSRADSMVFDTHSLAPSESRPRSDSILSERSEPPPLPASALVGSWEQGVANQILEAVPKACSGQGKQPYMVALVGIPGSGKTISSFMLANYLDEAGVPCMVMPHDGYHYPLEHLKTFPNAEDAIYRRGAPDTFDPHSLKRDLERIKSGKEELITLPAFDHSRGDPEPDTHAFDREKHQVVLCEGLYLLHDDDGWQEVSDIFDLTIFMDSDVDACIERVKIRNQCIPGYTPEEIFVRCEQVDRVNAMTVIKSRERADIVVQSVANKVETVSS